MAGYAAVITDLYGNNPQKLKIAQYWKNFQKCLFFFNSLHWNVNSLVVGSDLTGYYWQSEVHNKRKKQREKLDNKSSDAPSVNESAFWETDRSAIIGFINWMPLTGDSTRYA